MKSSGDSPTAQKEINRNSGNDINTNSYTEPGKEDNPSTFTFAAEQHASKSNVGTSKATLMIPPMPELSSSSKIVNKFKNPMKHHPIGHKQPKVLAQTSVNDIPSVQASNLNLIIERSNALCNRWHRMRLGEETGTKALNEYLKRRGVNKRNGEPYSTAQMVQMFDTLIPKTVPLPPNSQISKMMQKAQFGEGFITHSDVEDVNPADPPTAEYKSPLPKDALAKVYELMTTQSSYLSIKKRKIHNLDGDEVVERLKSFENRVCDLREKEEKLSKIVSKYGMEP